jgi:ABC-2 type transport system permease protein
MPVRPVEVMIAKIVPYIGIGDVQVRQILAVSVAVFQPLIRGSIGLLILARGLFIASNLAFGFTISTLARNQMLGNPAGTGHAFASILLSGSLYPFHGLPIWAR